MTESRRPARIPPLPPPLRDAPWVVWVDAPPAEGTAWTQYQLDTMRERYADDEEALDEAIGPDEGYVAAQSYGPYTELQARMVAAVLNRDDVREAEGIALATPMRLLRYYTPRGKDPQ